VQISPALSIANRAMDQLRKFCSELGMTPTSRARISIKPESDEDEWAGIVD
jgi:P27 family predicted phage terminase small subunit